MKLLVYIYKGKKCDENLQIILIIILLMFLSKVQQAVGQNMLFNFIGVLEMISKYKLRQLSILVESIYLGTLS